MNCHEFELELGDYVDGTLPSHRVEAVAAHIAQCARCRATVADFSAIRGAARTLEPQMPAAHVWTRIALAVDEESRHRADMPARPWWQLATGALAWRPLLAAAAMAVVLAGGTWLAWRQTVTTMAGTVPIAQNTAVVNPEVELAEQHYSVAIGDLEKVRQTESGSLDPETARVVQANLDAIDQAIGQSRAALQSEPASTVAQESLFGALRSKLQLLQDTVALINEMRKGNQEGAARIMSGMNP